MLVLRSTVVLLVFHLFPLVLISMFLFSCYPVGYINIFLRLHLDMFIFF